MVLRDLPHTLRWNIGSTALAAHHASSSLMVIHKVVIAALIIIQLFVIPFNRSLFFLASWSSGVLPCHHIIPSLHTISDPLHFSHSVRSSGTLFEY